MPKAVSASARWISTHTACFNTTGSLFDKPKPTNISFALEEVTLLAPCQPSKVVALWNNFHALSQKLDKAPPQHPLFLIKPHDVGDRRRARRFAGRKAIRARSRTKANSAS